MAANYRPDIDGLRAVSVWLVVVFHAFPSVLPGGFIGVDVFFVISGFLITRLLVDEMDAGEFSFSGFIERRIRRLLPALAVVVAATMATAAVILIPADFKALAEVVWGAVVLNANGVLYSQGGYFGQSGELKPLLHLWSLAVEEQFYVVFPAAIFIVARYGRKALLAVMASVLVASLAASVLMTAKNEPAAFFLAPFRAWELLIGAVLALRVLPAIASEGFRSAAAFIGLAAILVAAVVYKEGLFYPSAYPLLPCLGAAMVIYAGDGARGGFVGRTLSLRPMVFMGLISYSLYLWHWPILSFLRYVHIENPPTWERAVAIAVAVVLAVLSWRFVERPFRDHSRFRRPKVFLGAAAAGAAALSAAAAADVGEGLPWRWPEKARLLADGARDRDIGVFESCQAAKPDRAIGTASCLALPLSGQGPTFAVLGDSHALAAWPAVVAAAKRAGRQGVLLPLAGCTPLLDVKMRKRGRTKSDCDAYFRSSVEFVKSRPDIAKIFLIARWGKPLGGRGKFFDDESSEISIDENERVFSRGLGRMIEALAGRDVVIVSTVPEHKFHPPRVLAHAALFGWVEPKTPLSSFFDRERVPLREFEILARRPKVSLLHPWRALCSERYCPAQRVRSLYFDDDHLSGFGALAISHIFDPHLVQTVGAASLPPG